MILSHLVIKPLKIADKHPDYYNSLVAINCRHKAECLLRGKNLEWKVTSRTHSLNAVDTEFTHSMYL